jgi:peroxiredoxin
MTMAHNSAFAAEKNLTFELLGDPGNQTAQKYGLDYRFPEEIKKLYIGFGIDLPKHNGDESWTLPIPARFIVDRGGIIRYSEASVDHTVRPEPEETIAALKKL